MASDLVNVCVKHMVKTGTLYDQFMNMLSICHDADQQLITSSHTFSFEATSVALQN